MLLPSPPPEAAFPRSAVQISLCQEKPYLLLLTDNYGLIVLYKKKADTTSPQGPQGPHPPTEAEGAPSPSPVGGPGHTADSAEPFVQLQLDLQQHGPLLDAFWLPPLQQQQELQQEGPGAAAAEAEKTEGGCFFVTVQRHRVAVWSLPLLRILGVTLRRELQTEPLTVGVANKHMHAYL